MQYRGAVISRGDCFTGYVIFCAKIRVSRRRKVAQSVTISGPESGVRREADPTLKAARSARRRKKSRCALAISTCALRRRYSSRDTRGTCENRREIANVASRVSRASSGRHRNSWLSTTRTTTRRCRPPSSSYSAKLHGNFTGAF